MSRKNNSSPDSGILRAFEAHHSSLKRFISRYLCNAQDIEDVAQEAFLRAYSSEKQTPIEQPKSFLFRIAKNVAISELRLKSRQITDYLEEQNSQEFLSDSTPEGEAQAQQKLKLHCEAVASLPPQCRKVYLMRKVNGMSHKEIAESLDIAVSTVEKHLMKGVGICSRYVCEEKSSNGSGYVDIKARKW